MALLEIVRGDGSSAEGEGKEVRESREEIVGDDRAFGTSVGFGGFVEGEVDEGRTDAFEEGVEVSEGAVFVVEGELVDDGKSGEGGQGDGG